MRTSYLFFPLALFICLPPLALPVRAQEAEAGPVVGEGLGLTPAEQQELHETLQLTLQQQKERARELIRERPNTRLAAVLQRVLSEYEAFDRLHESERAARAAVSAWNRDYWCGRCPPEPPWHPPVGRIGNATDEPVLYEIRLTGIERTLWMGPYRLRAGASYESPHPYLVRYLTGGGVQEQLIVPGQSYAFQGDAAAGAVVLAPAPVVLDPAALPPAPAAE